jgi:hypothetical protein
MPRKRKTTRKRVQRVSVRAELRAEPDWDKFAYALLQYVKLRSVHKDTTVRIKQKPEHP